MSNLFDEYAKTRQVTEDIELEEWAGSYQVAQAQPGLSLELSSEGAPQGQGKTQETPATPPGTAPTPTTPGPNGPTPVQYPINVSAIRAGAAGEVTPQQVEAGQGVMADIGQGVNEAPQQVIGGARDAIVNAVDFIVRYSAPSVPGISEPAIGSGVLPAVTPTVPEAKSTTGGIIRGVSQFLTAFVPAGMATGFGVAGSAAAGAVADIAAFDPQSPRLSNLLKEVLPEALQNPVTDYLASAPDDTDAEGRLKNAVEGFGLGLLAEGLIRAAKAMKQSSIATHATKTLKSEEGAVRLPGGGEVKNVLRIDTATKPPDPTKPHGAYFSLADTGMSMYTDIGDVVTHAEAMATNPLILEHTMVTHPHFHINKRTPIEGPASAGVAALKKLVGDDEFARLMAMDKRGLVAELDAKFPGPNYTQYGEAFDLLEAYAGQEARRQGYDALVLVGEGRPLYEQEYVALTPDAAKTLGTESTEAHMQAFPDEAAARASIVDAAQQSPGKFNPQRQASTKLHQLTAQINVAARESGLMETQTRGTVGFDEITSAARRLIKSGKMSAERLLGMEPGAILTAEEGTAARFIRDATLKRHDQLMQMAEMGDEGAKSQIVASTYLASRIEAATEAASGTEPARALASRRIASRAKGTSMGEMKDLLRMIEEGPLTPEAETIIRRAAKGVHTAVRKAAEGVTGDEQGLMTAVADEMQALSESAQPGQVLGGLWDIMIKNAMQAQERPQSLELWTKILQDVQDRITNAVPEGQLLGGLMDVMLGDIAKADATIHPDLLLSFWKNLEGETERRAFVKHYEHFSRTGSIVNAFLEARAAGLIGARSMLRNVLGSGISTVWAIPERALAGTRPGGEVYMGEAVSMMHGMWQAQREALSMAGKALKTGDSQVFPDLDKFEYRKAISGEALKLTGTAGRAADVLGEVVRAKFRGLVAGDDYFKWINYKAEQYALAYRDYRQRLASGATQAQADAAYEKALTQPPDWLQKSAQEYSAYTTFNDDVLNKWGQKIMEIRNDDGWESQVSRFVLPFAKAPMNVGGYAAERTPGINLLSNHFWQEMQAGGARADLAAARLALGSALFGTLAGIAGSGYLNGKGPKNPELRKQYQENGWSPYSINHPWGNPIPFRGVAEPLGFILGAAADFAEVVNSGASAPDLLKLASATIVANLNYLEETGMLKGIADITEAIIDDKADASRLLHTMFSSAIPSPALPFMAEGRMLIEQVDPLQRETRGPHGGVGYLGRELELLQDDIMNKTVGLTNYMHPKRDRLGRPMLRQGGWWTLAPAMPSAQEPHPYLTEINKQGIIIEGTPKTLTRGRKVGPLDDGSLDTAAVELGPGEWDRFKVLEGQEVTLYSDPGKPGSKPLNLDNYLRAYVQSKAYAKLSDGPQGTKADELRAIVAEYREEAKERLLKEFPALRTKIGEKEELLDFEKMDAAEQARKRPALEKKYGRKIGIGITR